jgi:hypothetical protein
LDTLNELALALGNDENFSTTVVNAISANSADILANTDALASLEVADITDLTATATELNILDSVTATTTELNFVDGVTSAIQTQIESKQNELTGLTASVAELNILDGVTADSSELNALDGLTATTAELNFTDGVTSNIQTQLDARVGTTNGSVTTASTVSNVVRNITLSTAAPSGGADGDVWLVYTP